MRLGTLIITALLAATALVAVPTTTYAAMPAPDASAVIG